MAERVALTSKKSETGSKCSNSCQQSPSLNSSGSPADRILQLQKTAGNQAVQRLIESRVLQAKLKISQPNDQYEQEADKIAEQVIRMPDPVLRRKCEKCDNDKKKVLQTRKLREQVSVTQGQDVPPIIQEVLLSPGQSLDFATRVFMEPRFGHDFSGVRVHTDTKAAESARAVNALAYTVGRDVVFGEGRWVPGTHEGLRLIAHELTHIVQSGGGMTPPAASGIAHEANAARDTAAAASGEAPVHVSSVVGIGLAREEDPEVEKALGGLKEQEVPSGQPPKPAAQNALTPDELIDEHVFGPRVHEEVGDLRKRLANQEARLKANPKDKALQAKVTEMRAQLRALEGRGLDPSARGANVPGVGSINTRAAIQVIGPDGKIIAIERGSWGPTRHAEGDALAKLRSRLGTQKLPAGTRIVVAGNQVVCGEVCKPDIARFAKDYGVPLENVSASVRTRPKMVGQGQASGKTTERTGLRGDVPKATVKTEPLFPGGKEPPAQVAPPKTPGPKPSLPTKSPPSPTKLPPTVTSTTPKPAPLLPPKPTTPIGEPPTAVPTVKPLPASSPVQAPAPVVESPKPPVVAPPVRPTSAWKAGLKAGGKALIVALVFAGLEYLVHRQLEKDLEESIEKARHGAMPWAQRLKREDPSKPVYMRLKVQSEDYSRYVPFLGWMPEAPKLHMIQMAMVREEIDPPVVEVQDNRLNVWHPGVTTTVTYTELMVP